MAFAAVQAGRVAGVAVQLDDLVGGHAGILVQVVDVLGDDRARLAARDQPRDRVVAGVGRGAGPAGAPVKVRVQASRRLTGSATNSWK